MRKRRDALGLVRLRKRTSKEPTFDCGNCGCKRYSPCTCKKKEKK